MNDKRAMVNGELKMENEKNNSQSITHNSSLQKGYKNTEIGVIPDDWAVDKIENVCSITTGSKNTQDRIDGAKYPFFVRSQTVERINTYSFDGEAVLTAGDGVGTGKIYHYINDKFDFHQRVYKMSHYKENINGYFFYLYFSNHFYNRIMQMTAKSSVDSVRREMIADMKIPLPPLPEQTAIATVLSDTDSLIHALEKKIAKKQLIKKGAMQKLLTPKEGWEVKTLGNIADVTKLAGFEYSKHFNSYKDGGEIIVIRGTNITNNKLDLSDVKRIPCSTSRFLKRSRLNRNDLVFAYVGTIGPVYLIEEDAKYHLGPNTSKITLKNSVSPEYLLIYFKSEQLKKEITDKISVGAQPSLSMSKIRSFNIQFPINSMEQTRIAQILSDIDSEIELLQKKLAKYKQLKQGLMQNLLTGKIRLV